MKKLFRGIWNYIRHTDHWLWLLCLGLSGFSVIVMMGVYQTTVISLEGNGRRLLVQLGATCAGALAAAILSKIDYRFMTKLWKLHAPFCYALVLLTFVLGVGTLERPTEKLWFALPFGMTFQPSELLKISFILAFAYHLHILGDQINQFKNVVALALHGALPILLIHVQGDDGVALIFAFILVGMLFAAGLSWRYVFGGIGLCVAALPLAWMYIISDTQKNRILALYFPNEASLQDVIYQQYCAKLAIGSGQIWGKGLFSENHKYVPAGHTDFIFSFIAESFGFVGSIALILTFILLCSKILLTGAHALDLQGRLVCVGVFMMIASQSIINIGMCISLLPVIGITLPFLSSGGTSIAITYLGVGLVLSVYHHSKKSMFSS